LKKIIEPVSKNTSKRRCNEDLFYCDNCYYVIRLVYGIINHKCVYD